MYLKTLEMVGFKSFANPTTIHFHKGVTAIVGPNGCGKSNVLDSIRWVLGEQSAKALRGGSMQDVIFSGTDSKKPLGMAEVSLTFAECESSLGTDFHEVKVTRRVFRDGQGEYEINGRKCRLRDIQELFMDTGIGRTAYSIMEQGKIDQVLSSKPEDRRAVFEEAAGITRFKVQKREALRKLEATEANLLRVQDIIKEVRRQIGSLQRQASKARRFKEIYSRLRTLDTLWSRNRFAQWQGELDAAKERVGALQKEFGGLERSLEVQDQATRAKRNELEKISQEIREIEQRRAAVESSIQRARQQIEFVHQRVAEWEGLIERHRLEASAASERIRVQEEQRHALQTELIGLREKLRQARDECAAQQKQWQELKGHHAAKVREQEALRKSAAEAARLASQHKGRLESIEALHRSHLLRVEKLGEEEALWNQRLEELTRALAALREKMEAAAQARDRLQAESMALNTRVDEARDRFKEARRTLETAQARVAALKARMEALESLARSQTGFSQGVRRVMERFRGCGVAGTFLERLHVRPGSEAAVEVLLGRACEALLVEDAAQWEAIVSCAAEAEAGVVLMSASQTFPPLAPGIRAESALNHVQPEPDVRGWAERLLADCFIVEDPSAAQRLVEELPGAQVATLDGQLWHPSGWQARGSWKGAAAEMLRRENELAEKRREWEGASQAAMQAQEALDQAREFLTELESKVEELARQRQHLAGQLSSLQSEWEGLERQKKELETKREHARRELVQMRQEDEAGLAERSSLEEQIQRETGRAESLAAEAAGFEEVLANLSREVEKLGAEVTEHRVRVASLEQQISGREAQLDPLEARLQELREGIARGEKESEDLAHRIASARASEQEATLAIQQSGETLASLAFELEQKQVASKSLQAEVEELEKQSREERRRVQELQSACSREEIAVAECRMRLDNLAERIRIAYHIDLFLPVDQQIPQPKAQIPTRDQLQPGQGSDNVVSEGHPVPDLVIPEGELPLTPVIEPLVEVELPLTETGETDWSAVEQEVQHLRERIESMGPVNVDAITEFEELEQRHKFLEEQELDLTTARQQLLDAIRKINETTTKLFAETFAQIQQNFSQMFVDLFGGGKASLELVDADDPLESGIEIQAKPPGKQLQSISLLSGGEKTMTAVALLFSIYMVKPSPFCVLDEMDAPLDESNVLRFIRILKRFVHQSQFLVITHNKRTISAADVLYGVTMEQHGISSIVSVKLTRENEDPLFSNGTSTSDSPSDEGSRHQVSESNSTTASFSIQES